MTSAAITGAVGSDSSVCAGVNSSPPQTTIRQLFDMCQEVVFTRTARNRDPVARTPTVTIRSVIAKKRALPATAATTPPRRAACRAILSKLPTPAGIGQRTSPGPTLHQLGEPQRQLQNNTIIGHSRKTTPRWEALPPERVARKGFQPTLSKHHQIAACTRAIAASGESSAAAPFSGRNFSSA